jgi:hypothetical protein
MCLECTSKGGGSRNVVGGRVTNRKTNNKKAPQSPCGSWGPGVPSPAVIEKKSVSTNRTLRRVNLFCLTGISMFIIIMKRNLVLFGLVSSFTNPRWD